MAEKQDVNSHCLCITHISWTINWTGKQATEHLNGNSQERKDKKNERIESLPETGRYNNGWKYLRRQKHKYRILNSLSQCVAIATGGKRCQQSTVHNISYITQSGNDFVGDFSFCLKIPNNDIVIFSNSTKLFIPLYQLVTRVERRLKT